MKKIILFLILGIILCVFAQQKIQTPVQTAQQTKGEAEQIQQIVRSEIRTGNYSSEKGEQIQIKEQINNQIQITSKQVSANTNMELYENETKLQLKLSNGKMSELKIMPDKASETAIEQLRLRVCSEENNCEIELKEVGQGNEIKAAYEVKAQKQVKVFGIFQTQMQVKAQVNAENGEIIKTEKPWWSFLTTEQ